MVQPVEVGRDVLTHVTRLVAEREVKTGALKRRLRQAELRACSKGQAEHDLVVDLIAIQQGQGTRSIVDEACDGAVCKTQSIDSLHYIGYSLVSDLVVIGCLMSQ